MEIDISSVFQQMLILFLIMGLGYVANKTKIMSLESNKSLSKLVNCVTNPCNILYSALCNDHSLGNREVLGLLGLACGMYVVLTLLAQLVPRLLHVPKEQRGQYKFMMIFSNVGYMGIPVVSAIFGDGAVFYVSIIIMVFFVFIYTYGIYLICGGQSGAGFQLKELVTPMMISSVLGLVFYFLNVRMPVVVTGTLDVLRQVTTPCAMLIIGCALAAVPLGSIFKNWRLYVVSVLKLLVIPVATYFLLRPFVTNTVVLGVFVAIMGTPVATNFTMLSAQYDRDQKLASASIFITTLLSVGTIPLLIWLLFVR
ncbi:MAG: AEC family transporter [Oscillospiraceae bacterium]|nr:AEC family transporter [Oscillospiraceae bacterium]